jgi:hypothetical protein
MGRLSCASHAVFSGRSEQQQQDEDEEHDDRDAAGIRPRRGEHVQHQADDAATTRAMITLTMSACATTAPMSPPVP